MEKKLMSIGMKTKNEDVLHFFRVDKAGEWGQWCFIHQHNGTDARIFGLTDDEAEQWAIGMLELMGKSKTS